MLPLDDLERGRDPSLGTANAVNRRLGGAGNGTIQEQFGDPRTGSTTRPRRPGERSGATTPSTMTNAVAVGQTGAQRRVQENRIGRIFQRLESAAQSADLLASPGGANLVNLERRLNNWLRVVRASAPNPAALDARASELVAELVALLASYD